MSDAGEDVKERLLPAIATALLAEKWERQKLEEAIAATPTQIMADEARKELQKEIEMVGLSNNIDLIVETEKHLLSDEMQNRVASVGQKTALEDALKDLDIAEDIIKKVRKPSSYRSVAADYRREHKLTQDPKGRPRDQARQFFSSHERRLVRAMAAVGQGDVSQKDLLGARMANMRRGGRIYQGMQDDVLECMGNASKARRRAGLRR